MLITSTVKAVPFFLRFMNLSIFSHLLVKQTDLNKEEESV